MLVGGQPVPPDMDMPSLIQMVTRLPSGFKEKISHPTPLFAYVDDCLYNSLTKGKVFRPEESLPLLEETRELLLKKIDQPEGRTRHDKLHSLYINLGMLYDATRLIIQKKEEIGDSSGIDKLKRQLRPLRQMSCELMVSQRGERLDYGAWRVEQGEVGFSAKEEMGTDNVHECVAIALQEESSRETAFSHTEEDTNKKGLCPVLEKLSPGREPVVVGLAGAKSSGHFPRSTVARENVATILSVLIQYDNVNIVSSDLFNLDQPTAMVVDPLTFEFKEAVPARRNPNRDISNGKVWVISSGTPLHTCFDLTQSREYNPVFLSAENVDVLQERFLGEGKIQEWFDGRRVNDFQKLAFVERVNCLVEAYEESLAVINGEIEKKTAPWVPTK